MPTQIEVSIFSSPHFKLRGHDGTLNADKTQFMPYPATLPKGKFLAKNIRRNICEKACPEIDLCGDQPHKITGNYIHGTRVENRQKQEVRPEHVVETCLLLEPIEASLAIYTLTPQDKLD